MEAAEATASHKDGALVELNAKVLLLQVSTMAVDEVVAVVVMRSVQNQLEAERIAASKYEHVEKQSRELAFDLQQRITRTERTQELQTQMLENISQDGTNTRLFPMELRNALFYYLLPASRWRHIAVELQESLRAVKGEVIFFPILRSYA